ERAESCARAFVRGGVLRLGQSAIRCFAGFFWPRDASLLRFRAVREEGRTGPIRRSCNSDRRLPYPSSTFAPLRGLVCMAICTLMHQYRCTSLDFISDATRNRIAERLRTAFVTHFRYSPPGSEVRAWRYSLSKLADV